MDVAARSACSPPPEPFLRWFAGARLDAARASARAAGEGARRPLGAADRADRGGQDAGRLPADPGGVEQPPPKPGAAARARLRRPRHPPRGRAAHALHLAAEGARGRHRAQPGAAGGRDGAADPDRDPHRRHAGLEAPAPAPRPAAYPAHDAGAARAHPRVARCALSLRLAQARRARRAARAGHVEARRSAVARPRAAVHARARSRQRRAFGDCR